MESVEASKVSITFTLEPKTARVALHNGAMALHVEGQALKTNVDEKEVALDGKWAGAAERVEPETKKMKMKLEE